MNLTYLVSLFICCLPAGSLTTSAQIIQTIGCDATRLIRCQQEVLRDLQTASLNVASVQYPIGGPPYSPIKQHQQNQLLIGRANPGTCRLVRANLDCLLLTTPSCFEQGIQAAQNTDIIFRAKRFLEQNGCNEPDATWQSTFCYRSPEIRSCEERYGFTSSSALSAYANNASACLAYQAFKFCVDSHLRLNCKVYEIDMVNEYLIDRGSDLSWRCAPNTSASVISNPYQLSNRLSTILTPSVSNYNNYGAFDQRPIPTYVGSSAGNINLFRDQPWERFGSPPDDTRLGISRYPGEVSGKLLICSCAISPRMNLTKASILQIA